MIPDAQFTKDFSLHQMLNSETATRNNYVEQWNPTTEVVENLRNLSLNILQPLHDALGQFHINCAYRCKRDNDKVGGVSTSQHLIGQAADIINIVCGKNYNLKLAQMIIVRNLPFDQMIIEGGTVSLPRWVHVSFGPRNRRQIEYADFSKPIEQRYSPLTKEAILKAV